MNRYLVAAAIAIPGAAMAQSIISQNTSAWTTLSPSVFDEGRSVVLGDEAATVSDTGEVRIDWAKVEELAKTSDSPFYDDVSRAVARLMIAARDHAYKPMLENAKP